jgi:hypothetical protein
MVTKMTNDEIKDAVKEAVADFFSKDALLKRCATTFKEVEVPELSAKIRVTVVSAKDVSTFQAQFMDEDPKRKKEAAIHFKHRYVGRCLCDESGNLLFTEEEAERLGDMPAKDIEIFFAACSKVNPMGSEPEVEKEVKNSEATSEEDSSTASPES